MWFRPSAKILLRFHPENKLFSRTDKLAASLSRQQPLNSRAAATPTADAILARGFQFEGLPGLLILSAVRKQVNARTLLVTVLWAGVAFAMSMLCRGHAVKPAVPVTFLLALVPAVLIGGRFASLMVTVAASFIFAMCLFEPYGSLAIRSRADRLDLLCFALAAVAVVYLSPRPAGAGREKRDGLGHVINTSELLENWIAVVVYALIFTAIVTVLLYMWS